MLALAKAGGTFRYCGMAFGAARGVITVDPVNIEHMLRTRFSNYPKGKYYRERFRDLLGSGIFNADDAEWKEQRWLAMSEKHSSRFVWHSYDTVWELVHHKLLKLLEARAATPGDDKSLLDIQDVLLQFTFDNICITAFGVNSGCLTVDLPEVRFARAFEEATELTLIRFSVPPYRRLKEAVRIVQEFADKTVSDRRMEMSKLGSLSDRSDILSRLMENKNHDFSDKFLGDFCVSFILADRDTSSVALAWFFWLIYKHPEVEAKVLSQINRIILWRRPLPAWEARQDTVFTQEELTDMVYLQAALSESLDDDVLPDGTELKRGDRVMHCIFSMARVQDGQRMVCESQFKYVVFNAGPRLCVGKKFTYMQMKMVAASVLWRYSVVVAEGHRAVPKVTTTLSMKHGLLVTLRPRVARPGSSE
ncbi:hypothetical protein EUGRSUZ_H02456 [Eucalyptus grandis]|uniref:Uncharacterized protein n=2 Tax=Eucalyptus grandis TaxID=71139 RepID=A0ACC3JSK9_EUCGR|nr:hypothetical protein EUGRSUZ_H02456 [Eucalyptus grandis]